MNKAEIIQQLYQIEAIKFGNFTLKSGVISPIYIDLRQIIAYPKLMQSIARLIWEQVKHIECDMICGVPYTALPLATCIAVEFNKPMLIVRKEAKAYGTKKQIEGRYKPGQTCLIIEDVVTSASSVLGVIEELKKEGLIIHHAAAFLDRQQHGEQNLANAGCEFFKVISLTDIVNELKRSGISLPTEL